MSDEIDDRGADLTLRNLNRDMRDRFKAHCATHGRNMTEVIVEFMHNCITGEQEKIKRQEELQRLRELQRIKNLASGKPQRKRKKKVKGA